MTENRHHPAVFAGLLGMTVGFPNFGFPTLNLPDIDQLYFDFSKLDIQRPVSELLSHMDVSYVQFGLGVVAGFALSTAIHITVGVVRDSHRRKTPQEPAVRRLMTTFGEVADGLYQDYEEELASTSRPARPAGARAAGRHMASRDWESSGVIRVQDIIEPRVEPFEDASWLDSSLSSLSMGAQGYKPLYVPYERSEYDDIADSYVRRKHFNERAAVRRAGVASILAERLGPDPFDGLPVIERADGSVGDVGTFWWNLAFDSAVRPDDDVAVANEAPRNAVSDLNKSAEGLTPTSFYRASDSQADLMEQRSRARDAARISATPAEVSEKAEMFANRAEYISKKVNEIDVGVYPEHRSAADLEQDALWESALQAMDDRLTTMGGKPSPVFNDEVGTIETIDEPYGIEGPTNFIPFRVHTNHPEVVDSESYVNYLLDDEISQISKRDARKAAGKKKGAKGFLTVIQGGQRDTKKEDTHRPKHFATPARDA